MRITYTECLLRIRSIYRNMEDSLNTGNLYIIKGEKWAEIRAERPFRRSVSSPVVRRRRRLRVIIFLYRVSL